MYQRYMIPESESLNLIDGFQEIKTVSNNDTLMYRQKPYVHVRVLQKDLHVYTHYMLTH